MDYQLKKIPDDFVVDELLYDLPSHKSIEKDMNKRKHSFYKLYKKNLNTMDAIKIIERFTNINRKDMMYLGLKDKVAKTVQYLTIRNGPSKNIKLAKDDWELELTYIKERDSEIIHDELKGNRFTITVRGIDRRYSNGIDFISQNIELFKSYINFFGEQRFGVNNDNHIIGKLILQKKDKEAVDIINKSNNEGYKIALLDDLSRDMVKFYLHSYQSHLWNETVKDLVDKLYDLIPKEELEDKEKFLDSKEIIVPSFFRARIPMIGFDVFNPKTFERMISASEMTGKIDHEKMISLIKEAIMKKMDEERLSAKDFIFRSKPYLSMFGESRDAFIEAENVIFGEKLHDDMNEGKNLFRVTFDLPKGVYATEYIKHICNVVELFSDIRVQGGIKDQ